MIWRETVTRMTPRPLFDLYIASCLPDGGVLHALLNEDGTLTPKERVKAPSPMFLCFGDGGIYALLRSPFPEPVSGLTHLPFAENGALYAPGQTVATGGVVACHLCRWRGQVYAVNYLSGSVARISYPAGLTALDIHPGKGVDPLRQDMAHTHFIAPAPDGEYLLSTDLGLDTVYTYDEKLRVVSEAAVPAGHGARHLAYSPDGRFVYCVNELKNTVTVFAYDKGVLTAIRTVDALGGCDRPTKAAAIRLKEGILYVSHRGDDSIALLRAEGAEVSFLGKYPCRGKSPRDLDLFGDFLVCTNEEDGKVTVFRLEKGGLRYCSTLEIENPLCVIGKEIGKEAIQ